MFLGLQGWVWPLSTPWALGHQQPGSCGAVPGAGLAHHGEQDPSAADVFIVRSANMCGLGEPNPANVSLPSALLREGTASLPLGFAG